MRTKTDKVFRLIALATIAVLTTCLLLVGGAFRLQSKKMQRMGRDLALERKYSCDLDRNIKAYEAAYPEPADVPHSAPGVVTGPNR